MIWPIVGGLMARFGRRHISNVVALCATGSYARDLTRSVEDANAYAALSELEVLSGLRSDAKARDFLRAMVADTGSDLSEHVGEKLFDHIYLLDREKSNQGLSEDSQELAVLASNALEALIVGSGDMYLQEQLGFHVHAAESHPYSLIGAASDYVPLDQMLHAVNRQEESRLVRDWVLRSTPEEAAPAANPLMRRGGQQADLSLTDLGFSQPRALQQLALRLPAMFTDEEPERIDDLAVSTSFVFPAAAAAKLRRLSPQEWHAGFEQHLVEVKQTFNLAAGPAAVDEAWGISLLDHEGAGLSVRHEADDRLVPQLLTRMHKRLVDLLSASPTGLTRARAQTQHWLQETEEALQKLQISSTPSMRKLEDVQHDLDRREWTLQYDETTAKLPTAGGILLRGTLSVLIVAFLAAVYLWIAGRMWNPVEDGLALAGFATGILLAGLFSYRYASTRRSTLRHARVELARTELSARLRVQVYDGLRQTYQQLVAILHGWHDMLGEAMDELHALSTPPQIPAVPPVGVPQTYLYQPHINQKLWDQCLTFLRSHLDGHGQRSEERLDELWGEMRWRTQMQQILRQSTRPNSGSAQARAIAEFIRETVRKSVAPVSLERTSPREVNPLRAQLMRALAREFTVEHMLWRGAAEAQDIERRLRAMAMTDTEVDPDVETETLTNRRYVESAWHRAKPTANYDVADRLAVYGITVDFAAISGAADSDLTRALLDEFNIALLPTENPFGLTFVRTVHGLSLDDLDCMRRYRSELRTLTGDERALIFFVNAPVGSLYRTPVRSTASDNRPPRPNDPPVHENA